MTGTRLAQSRRLQPGTARLQIIPLDPLLRFIGGDAAVLGIAGFATPPIEDPLPEPPRVCGNANNSAAPEQIS